MDADHAGKITGMLLEMSEADVIRIFEDRQACEEKVYLKSHKFGMFGPAACAILLVGEAKRVLIQSIEMQGQEDGQIAESDAIWQHI